MERQNSLAEIAEVLRSASKVLVLSHYNPDPDAYGSACGLALALRGLGKTVLIANESGVLDRLAWIPGVTEVKSELPGGAWDVLVACDCGDGKRVGDRLKDRVLSHPNLVNLDHHPSNDFFGKYNYVMPSACSTSEIIFDLLEVLNVRPSKEVATCLYAGVSGDTGSFKYSSTNAKSFALAQRLVEAGALPGQISKELYGRTSLAALKLQAEALGMINLHAGGKITLVSVSNEMLRHAGAEREDADVLVDIARDIEGVLVSILLKEDYGFWRVSLRSSVSDIDLSSVAGIFGGGGHKAAAGFRWRRPIAELENLLLTEILKQIK